jgi:orotidine-5'-phosphate decarboxylase
MTSSAKEKIIVALDMPDSPSALNLVDQVADAVLWVKVGLQLFTAEGPGIVKTLKERRLKVFLDLKFHDIPNTTQEAMRSAVRLGVDMVTIHLSGGGRMVRSAVEAATDSPLLVLGVTVLTSFDEAELRAIGVVRTPEEQVADLVALGRQFGLRGVVCSPREITPLRRKFGDSLTIVTPGVRPAGSATNDQQRVMTPAEAIRAGANHLVIGRPITAAKSPREAALRIADEIEGVLPESK